MDKQSHSRIRRSAVFLDRDGTINVDVPGGYTHRIEDFAFEEGAIAGLKKLSELDLLLIITTGQSGIGRGYYTEQQFQQYMDHMTGLLAHEGVQFDAVYHCPHHPEKALGDYCIDCPCRKPKAGMIDQACRDMREKGVEIDLSSSFVVGDKTDDGKMGNNAACASVLVECPSGNRGLDGRHSCQWDFKAINLEDAASWIEAQLLTRRI